MVETIDETLGRASAVTRAAVADGPLAIVAIALAVLSFLVGQAGTSLAYLHIDQVDYAHLINEDVLGVAGVMAAVGVIAAIGALAIARGTLRTWRKELAAAALILGLLSAGLHGTIWGMSIQHHAPASPSNVGP
jgi:hypothetical protein